jgi:hypothetical protein
MEPMRIWGYPRAMPLPDFSGLLLSCMLKRPVNAVKPEHYYQLQMFMGMLKYS